MVRNQLLRAFVFSVVVHGAWLTLALLKLAIGLPNLDWVLTGGHFLMFPFSIPLVAVLIAKNANLRSLRWSAVASPYEMDTQNRPTRQRESNF